MRLIFMGTPDFSVPALRALHGAGHQIAAVYTQQPRPAGRGQAPRPSPVMQAAEGLGLPVRHPARLRDPAEQAAFAALRAEAAVVDASDGRGQAVRMANPQVLHASVKLAEHQEGSPNLPGVAAMVSRPRAVTVRFLNADGAVEERDFVGLWAASVQHQIDHHEGRMYFDRLSKLKRDMLLRRAAKLAAAARMA